MNGNQDNRDKQISISDVLLSARRQIESAVRQYESVIDSLQKALIEKSDTKKDAEFKPENPTGGAK